MALLTLKDIGKIYVSEGNVTVGIRGVNMSFNRGEFVAVTGKSGSGKSTLLNVISGMDSYEEGELLIEGQPTSHYLQPEWEAYRQQYISFIFQDYNIIESFTVLQNVELALMHIIDPKARRKRALELIDRVGLRSHLKHKGSKLSGGQKQRTVIARALAKDSPIILADEPTGNLDSATSAEIIALLHEVSKDKLLIVVTHNFEQLEACATRHIRIFDGAVESDHILRPGFEGASSSEPTAAAKEAGGTADTKKPHHRDIKNGIILGRSIFAAKPRLSLFLCLLMIVGLLGIFLTTAFCGEALTMFEDYTMFRHIDGRVVLTKENGSVFSEDELQELSKQYGAHSYLHFDSLLDASFSGSAYFTDGVREYYLNPLCSYGERYEGDLVGRYPEKDGEVLLYLPISYQKQFGDKELAIHEITMNGLTLEVCGVQYYLDNNLQEKCLFTKEGFRSATAAYQLRQESDFHITLEYGGESWMYSDFLASYAVDEGKVYPTESNFWKIYEAGQKIDADSPLSISFDAVRYSYNYYWEDGSKDSQYHRSYGDEILLTEMPEGISEKQYYDGTIAIHPTLLREIAEDLLSGSYRQASLFFADDDAADHAAHLLRENGYIAVPSYTTYTPDAMSTILMLFSSVALAMVFLLAVVFLAFFINLCSSRALSAFKGDMAILRSMGISVKTIRIGMYVRMLLSLIPAYALVILSAIFIYRSPTLNGYFVYLYFWQYALIFLGMLLITIRVTHKQIRKLFGESVKKALKGGTTE